MKILIIIINIICFCFAFENQTYAQPAPPEGHGKTENQGGGAPIDGGLTLLIALGAIYGIEKNIKKKKKNL